MSAKKHQIQELVAILPKRTAAFILPHVRWLCGLPPTIRCQTCGRFRSEVYPQPIDIKIYQFARGLACGILYDFCIGIIHRDLYDDLDLNRYGFVSGACYEGTGELLRTHVTFYNHPRIGQYGSEANEKFVCSACGHFTVKTKGDYFLLAEEIQGRPVIQDQIGDLYVTPKLADRIDWKKYRSIRPFAFPIRAGAESIAKMRIKRVGMAFFKCTKPELITRPGSARWEDWAHGRD